LKRDLHDQQVRELTTLQEVVKYKEQYEQSLQHLIAELPESKKYSEMCDQILDKKYARDQRIGDV
jgi:hypothetical protein